MQSLKALLKVLSTHNTFFLHLKVTSSFIKLTLCMHTQKEKVYILFLIQNLLGKAQLLPLPFHVAVTLKFCSGKTVSGTQQAQFNARLHYKPTRFERSCWNCAPKNVKVKIWSQPESTILLLTSGSVVTCTYTASQGPWN